MCLAVPVKIIDTPEEGVAKVEIDGIVITVSSLLAPDVKIGEYVLVHAGFIIEKLSSDEANARLNLFEEIYQKQYSREQQ